MEVAGGIEWHVGGLHNVGHLWRGILDFLKSLGHGILANLFSINYFHALLHSVIEYK